MSTKVREQRQYVRLRSIPVPSPAFFGKHRQEDSLVLYADHYSLIVCYKAKLPNIHSLWVSRVLVQFLGYSRYEHSSVSRGSLAKPKHESKARSSEHGGQVQVELISQGSRICVYAKSYRVYAIKEPECGSAENELISPEELLAKRRYWEMQLRGVHFSLFDGVNDQNKERVWQRIQERYLFKYRRFLRIEADWGSSGIWGTSFPGSYGTNPNYSHECFPLPKRIVARFKKWHASYDSRDPSVEFDDPDFDWPAFNREGDDLARELKKVVDAQTYVEYHPGVEIKR